MLGADGTLDRLEHVEVESPSIFVSCFHSAGNILVKRGAPMAPMLSLGPAFRRVEWPASASCSAGLRGSCSSKAYVDQLAHETAAMARSGAERLLAAVQDIAACACVSWTLQMVGAVHIALHGRSNCRALGIDTCHKFCATSEVRPQQLDRRARAGDVLERMPSAMRSSRMKLATA